MVAKFAAILFLLSSPFFILVNSSKGEELKIRYFGEHGLVIVGNYEYDYLEKGPPRRRIVKGHKAEEAENQGEMAAMGMKERDEDGGSRQKRTFYVQEADNVFYEMVAEEGWTKGSYSGEGMRICRAFVFEFVCKLYGREGCPGKWEWPDNFLKIDKNTPLISVFSQDYKQRIRPNFNKQKDKHCHLKDLQIHFAVANRVGHEEFLPPIVEIATGRRDAGKDADGFLADAITVQERAVHQGGNKYKVTMKGFVCRWDGESEEHGYFKDLVVMDDKGAWKMHTISHGDFRKGEGQHFVVDLAGEFEPVKEPKPKQAQPPKIVDFGAGGGGFF